MQAPEFKRAVVHMSKRSKETQVSPGMNAKGTLMSWLELQTKPTQKTVQQLNAMEIQRNLGVMLSQLGYIGAMQARQQAIERQKYWRGKKKNETGNEKFK